MPRFGLAIRARISGNASIGQMKAFHSNSFRSSQSSRSSSAGSKALPRRLQRTSRCGGATVEIGIELKPAEAPDGIEHAARAAVEGLRADGDSPRLLRDSHFTASP